MLKDLTATPDPPETLEKILEAAEYLLRRHGPAKTKVIDVARHLGMSNANVYRFVDSKADLQDHVASRWLKGIADPLDRFVHMDGPAEERLRGWVDGLIEIKQEKIQSDPELFATYNALAEASRKVIAEHVEHLRQQLGGIIADGVKRGEFKVSDVPGAARAIHEGTSRFQHPYFVTRSDTKLDGVKAVMQLFIAGLKAGVI